MVTKDPCIKEGSLIDEMGARFQVYRDHQGYAHILNSADTFLLDHMVELERIGCGLARSGHAETTSRPGGIGGRGVLPARPEEEIGIAQEVRADHIGSFRAGRALTG